MSYRILFLNVTPMPHSIDLHRELSELGNDVTFWYLNAGQKTYPWEKISAAKHYYIFDKTFSSFQQVFKQARRQDLVVITGWHSWGHVMLAALLRFVPRTKCVFWSDVPEPPRPGILKRLKLAIMNLVDGYFITGTAGFRFFEKVYKIDRHKLYDFPYLENKPNINEILEINRIRAEALREGGKVKLLISNRFIFRKGYHIIVKALSELSASTRDGLEVDIVGTGLEREAYENKLRELSLNIKFHGWLEYEDYLSLMNNTDIFVHASIHEPYGIPPMDAMSRGKLLISSDAVISAKSRIKQGYNAYLYSAHSSFQLKQILEEAVNHPENIYRLGSRAMEDSKMYTVQYNLESIKSFLAANR